MQGVSYPVITHFLNKIYNSLIFNILQTHYKKNNLKKQNIYFFKKRRDVALQRLYLFKYYFLGAIGHFSQ